MKKSKMNVFPAQHPNLIWQGRTMKDNSGNGYLIGSASSLKFRFQGNQCRIWLLNVSPPDGSNYISWVLDGSHYKRIPVGFEAFTSLDIPVRSASEFHDIEIYKETESSCGYVVINKIEAEEISETPKPVKKKIEFIGNSITAGMASDPSLVPCDEGNRCDQHNAYNAYGPRVARTLDCDYMIVAVSGIGAYRNWNTEYPVMPDVYESTFLTGQSDDPKWKFDEFIPDLVCINLGTNDFSDGDGITPRLPFDSTKFIDRYVELIGKVHNHYPEAKFLLLQHRMPGQHHMSMLDACLQSVKQKAETSIAGLKPVSILSFSYFIGSGCSGHPSVDEHGKMARELAPVISKLLR